MATSKRILITGATSGIGLDAARQLIELGHEVHITGRDVIKIQVAIEDIQRPDRPKVQSHVFDLRDLNEVRAALPAVCAEHYNIVILNAGVMFPLQEKEFPQKVSHSFLANALGHAVLAEGIISAADTKVHFVTISSSLTRIIEGMKRIPRTVEEWEKKTAFEMDEGWAAYAYSKVACVILSQHLASFENVTSVAVDPGNVRTKITRRMPHWQERFFSTVARFKTMTSSLESCSKNVVDAALAVTPSGVFREKDDIKPLHFLYSDKEIISSFAAFCHKLSDQSS